MMHDLILLISRPPDFLKHEGGIILLIFAVVVTPTKRGFYCDDESIRYPFKDSTVPNWALYIYCFSIPLLVVSGNHILISPINICMLNDLVALSRSPRTIQFQSLK
jgi:hypothetical protein